ncbi:MAG: hypothetical protein WBM83_01415 [Flavobacteriaceae bacterium]
METQCKSLSDKINSIEIFRNAQKWMATIVLFAVVLSGCSKGDDGLTSVDQVQQPNENGETKENTGTTGSINEGVGVIVTIKSMAPVSPASLKFEEDVEVTYDYEVTRNDGARIWIFPFTNGNNTPHYKYELSPKYMGKGTQTVKFTVTEGDSVVVDQLKIQIGTGGYSLLGTVFWDPLIDLYETVDYTFTN